jgi:L-seryl-tRNA(Ser) seleniumtransferase
MLTRMGKPAANREINPLRALPQVEAVLSSPVLARAVQSYRHEVLLRQIRLVIAAWRERLAAGQPASGDAQPGADLAAHETVERLAALEAGQLRRVVNATGVLLHTNLGRSALGARAREALLAAAGGYCDLELDLPSGKRSHRDKSIGPLICALTGAEAATVVNNCAAAVYLILATLAKRREVVTSRGELVEIGGNFRIPDVVRASGCKLVEVGTTNRTRLADYAAALTERTALVLKTHQSNYRIRGFTEEAQVAELAGLARARDIPLVFDAGSGMLSKDAASPHLPVVNPAETDDPQSRQALHGSGPAGTEPAIADAIAGGANLVCFSGDKLLGGPQAGIICGDAGLIAKLRKSPLWRALRVDKLTLAALGATLAESLHRPDHRMGGGLGLLTEQLWEAEAKAGALARLLQAVQPGWQFELVEVAGSYGGGTLPDESCAGWAVAITPRGLTAAQLGAALRFAEPAVLGVMHRGRYCLHVAALLPGDAERIALSLGRLGGG